MHTLTRSPAVPVVSPRGFSLLDLIVSMGVVALLMAITLPALSAATEASRRVVCQSNIRQIGLGMAMYAEDNNNQLPPSEYASGTTSDTFRPDLMVALHTGKAVNGWDGLGWLFARDYLRTPSLYYCPSHRGEHTAERYAEAWQTMDQVVIGNYHLRAFYPGMNYLTELASSTPIVADALQSSFDFSHKIGLNVLHADQSVHWVLDDKGEIAEIIPAEADEEQSPDRVYLAWWVLDQGTQEDFPGLPWRPNTTDPRPSSNSFELPRH